MNLRNIYLLILCLLTISCASKRPAIYTDYDKNLVAPHSIGEIILMDKIVHDDPLLGVSLAYQDKAFPEDRINIYIYPMREISWENKPDILNTNIGLALKDVDTVIEYGHYKSRTAETLSDFNFTSNDVQYSGKKAAFNMFTNNGILVFSDIYLFIAQDKLIKFRTSFNSHLTKQSMGDSIVEKILPHIQVPPESIYMKNLRKEHKKKMRKQLMNIILEAMKKSEKK